MLRLYGAIPALVSASAKILIVPDEKSATPDKGDNRLDSSVSGCDYETRRIWSLWDLLKFNADILVDRMLCLSLVQYAELQQSGAQQGVIADLERVQKVCSEIGLDICAEKAARAVDFAREHFDEPDGVSALANDLVADIQAALEKREFLYVKQDRSGMADNPMLFGSLVAEAFPDARLDVQQAGNCLAAECNTAAVFHLMRSVECGMRALCESVGLIKVKKTTKAGKTKYTPISHAQWEDALNQLQKKIDDRLAKIKRGPKKQRDQEFYYPVLQDISGIRDAWRNHVMHSRAEYSREAASVIFGHVERILKKVAERIVVPTSVTHPIIVSAMWGIGGGDYVDVTEQLRGYLASDATLLASNRFFSDHYPGKDKHLMVKFRNRGSNKTRTLTFAQNEPVRFAV